MVARYIGDAQWTALDADPKPTNAAIGDTLKTDTGKRFFHQGSGVWVEFNTVTEILANKTISNDDNALLNIGYNSIIYKSGSVYKAKAASGALLASSTVLDGVVQAALDNKGLIIWPAASDGTAYLPSSSLTGWEFSSNTSLVMGYNTRVTVPEIFSGTVFKINDAYNGAHVAYNIKISGGIFQQAGVAPDANWTFCLMESSSSTTGDAGVGHCTLRDIYAKRCKHFVVLKADTGDLSWVNGNNFDNIWCDYPHEGIVFIQGSAAGVATKATNRNHFNNVTIQADPSPTVVGTPKEMLYGFKDISGINNCFFNCRVWDVVIPNVAARISSKAENTLIKGGLMAQQPFDWEVSQNWGIATTVEGLEKTGGYGVGMNNALANPFIRKTGICCATGPAAGTIAADGTLGGFAHHGTAATYTTPTPTANGHFKRVDTTAVAGTLGGWRSSTPISSRYFSPIIIMRFKLGQTTAQRVFIGFSSAVPVSLGTDDDPLVSMSGFGLFHSTTHATSATNWLSCTNTGAATSTFANTGIAANNTAVHTIIIAGWEDTTPKFQWRVDNVEGQIGDVTATIPGQFTALALGIWISNGVAAAAKTMDFFGAYHKHGVREGG